MKILSNASGIVAALCLAAMVLILLAEIIVRPFGMIIHSAADIATFLMVAVAWFGFVHTFLSGKHIRVELLTRHLAAGPRRWLECLSLIGATVLLAWLAFASAKLVHTAWRFNDMTDTVMRIHLWIPMSVVPIGLALFALATFGEAVLIIRGGAAAATLSDEDEALALARSGDGDRA